MHMVNNIKRFFSRAWVFVFCMFLALTCSRLSADWQIAEVRFLQYALLFLLFSFSLTMLLTVVFPDSTSESIWALVTVEENGLLGLTQQMSRIGDFAMPRQHTYEEHCRHSHSQMALVPVSSASDVTSAISHNPFGSQQSQSAAALQQSLSTVPPSQARWLLQVLVMNRLTHLAPNHPSPPLFCLTA